MLGCSNILVPLTVSFEFGEVPYSNTTMAVKPLVPKDAHAASQGTGFSSFTTLHVCQPIMTIFEQSYGRCFLFFFSFCKSLRGKIKSCGLNLVFCRFDLI